MSLLNPTLTINLAALIANYNLLKNTHAKNSVAAVVKANAYGLGVSGVSKALWAEGCRNFFVATLEEGVELRGVLPDANIGLFQGIFPGEESEYIAHNLSPVLNDLSQLGSYTKILSANQKIQAIIHVDTGMTRLGLCESDLKNPILSTLNTQHSKLLISHLACADTPTHEKNAEQLARFHAAIKYFPDAKYSLANSAGVFLPQDYHFDIARTGCALYGISPKNPMRHVATLSAPILQIRTLDRDETVGYGATAPAKKGARIAITALGYADGYFRMLGNLGHAYIAGQKLPLIGRVSMDMVAIDVSSIPEAQIDLATSAEFINAQQTVDDVAQQCGTIGYEIFTRIGRRVKRVYS
jgi:alanine racemase